MAQRRTQMYPEMYLDGVKVGGLGWCGLRVENRPRAATAPAGWHGAGWLPFGGRVAIGVKLSAMSFPQPARFSGIHRSDFVEPTHAVASQIAMY